MKNSRIPVPDLMKGIAVVAMIQVHIMELFARQDILEGAFGKMSLFLGGPFAAPVFMAVMGYFLAYSQKSFIKKIKRGAGILFLGILLNIGLNLHLLIKIWNGVFDLDPLEYILGADILILAGLGIIIIALMERFSNGRFLPFFMFAIGIAVVTPYLPDLPENYRFLLAFLYGNYSWSYFPLFPWLAYPFIGYAFGSLEKSKPEYWGMLKNRLLMIMLFSALIILILIKPSIRIIIDLPSYYHHGVLLFAWMTGFLAFYTWLTVILEKYLGGLKVLKYLKWLGKNVTVVYVVQWLIIGNTATAIYKSQPLLSLFIWFIAILALTSVLSYLFIKIRPVWKR